MGAADPVGLHGAHPLRPAVEFRQIVEQLVGVGGDLQEPLAQLALFNQGAGAPGAPFAIHLFIGQHRLVDRVPVDRRLTAVGQAGIEELQEQPLGPAVVVGVAGGQLPVPVDRQAEPLQLLPHLGDVLVGPGAGIDAPLDRRVLRRQTEGIPAHRMQHGPAAQALHPGDHVGDHIVAHMAHVQAPRGIGEHRQGVIGLGGVGRSRARRLGGQGQRLALPALLPELLDHLRPVAGGIGHGGSLEGLRSGVIVP